MVRNDVLANIRERLQKERESLVGDLDALDIENQAQQDDYGVGNHMADDATEVFTRERNIALHNNAQDLLDQVDAALERLEAGTYGACARCGKEIPAERLEAKPYALYCIDCQTEIEHQR
jgi:DnaK suppressor protein